ncbi:hypothetical protein AVEN_201407-1 [Araneus ventricosus]|uniref:Uncharacterized protein n=1 Tax=Araneus ventricosus TaxID=182803 RepID=A0A4Y2WNQ4_ARAVE|nr:hypothetical protein AVEN_201407-1 [Araneus ventricosus]
MPPARRAAGAVAAARCRYADADLPQYAAAAAELPGGERRAATTGAARQASCRRRRQAPRAAAIFAHAAASICQYARLPTPPAAAFCGTSPDMRCRRYEAGTRRQAAAQQEGKVAVACSGGKSAQICGGARCGVC